MLSGYEAYREVEAAMGGRHASADVAEYPFKQVIRAAVAQATPLDLAVLLRTALRYWSERSGRNEEMRVSPALLPDVRVLDTLGIELRRVGTSWVASARPWSPSWLECPLGESVDGRAAAETPRRNFPPVSGDPFLAFVDLPGDASEATYRSIAQRAAVRAVLGAPPGSVLAVCLGTGEGKSLAFQLVSQVGFGDPTDRAGVTLVVTPTVALAMDHEVAAAAIGMADKPRAYVGDGAADAKDRIQREIEEGTQGLVFTSPEAACGSLRPSLERAASLGHLRCMVVDEAHLVETWGDEFRPDFQLLGGLRKGLLRASSGVEFRTLLLSATLAAPTLRTLGALFNQDDVGIAQPLPVVGAVSLRSEMDYWAGSPTDEGERRLRLIDAMMHVPRPAIVYATRRADAEAWHREALALGFRRVALFTGSTPDDTRRKVIESWRAGDLDMVFATSAFGLGIDHQKVRSVIHACVPETLDRFYQEVGRGGRDGNCSLSVLVPSWRDLDDAKRMNRRKLIGITLGRQRWDAMFRHPDREFVGNNDWILRVDVAPGRGRGRHDMVNERSIGWNVKTLTLMASAGLLALEDASVGTPIRGDDTSADGWREMQRVRILEPGHLSAAVWARRVEPYRKAAGAAADRSLRLLIDYVHRRKCIGRLLAAQYTVGAELIAQGVEVQVAPTCPGCAVCRGSTRVEEPARPLPWPWSSRRHEPLAPHVDSSMRLLVLYDGDLLPEAGRPRRRRLDCLSAILRTGIRNLVASGSIARALQQHDRNWPLFNDADPLAPDLPPGPVLYIFGSNGLRSASLLRAPDPSDVLQPRILLLAADTPDPTRRTSLVTERYSGRRLDLGELCEAVTG